MEGFQFIFPEDEIVDQEVSDNIDELVKHREAEACEIEQFDQEIVIQNKIVEKVHNESENGCEWFGLAKARLKLSQPPLTHPPQELLRHFQASYKANF